MALVRRGALVVATILISCSFASAQSNVAEAQAHQRTAFQAYRDGDFETFAASLETALALNPGSLATRYNLACGYALTGRHGKALELLAQLARQKVDFGMADDQDLASLQDMPEFRELVGLLEHAVEPISNSSVRFELERYGLIPEGIAIDRDTGRIFLGSMRTGDIFVIDDRGRVSKFTTVRHEGTLATIGLTVDSGRGLLWAVGTAFNLMEDFDPDAPPKTGVFGFDLATGIEKQKYIADETVQGFNDVTVAPDGDLYVSGAVLSRVSAGGDALEPLETSVQIVGSNGIAVTHDGHYLFVSSYPVGLARVDLESGDTVFLSSPEDTTLYGIDGLYWYEGDLIGVQNGVQPWRLIRLSLDADQDAVTSVRMLEYANERATSMTGAIDGDVIHYVGRGPAPEDPPGHFPEDLRPFSGKTIVMTAPLDP